MSTDPPRDTIPVVTESATETTNSAIGMVMPPPEGFLERAVERGLALVHAEEALAALDDDDAIYDEVTVEEDSGVFERVDDGPPTLRNIQSS